MVRRDYNGRSCKARLGRLVVNEYYTVECFHIPLFCLVCWGGLKFLLGLCYTLSYHVTASKEKMGLDVPVAEFHIGVRG